MASYYCPECDKDFKSIAGLNGHNQFKHNKLPESLVSNNPTGRTVAMLELMKDQVAELKLEIQGLRADFEIILDEDDDEDANGNPNSQQKFAGEFACLHCRNNNGEDQYLSPNQEVCLACGRPVDWAVALV